MPLQVELVSPERLLFEGEAEMVVARTVGGGDIAFLPGHTPFLGVLDSARVLVRSGDDQVIAVHGGFVEVSDDHVTILSEVAEMAEDIDVDRARRARDSAEQAAGDEEDDEAREALKRANTRLRAAGAED